MPGMADCAPRLGEEPSATREEREEEEAPPLVPSYPPPLSPGMKRATGRPATGGDTYGELAATTARAAAALGPLRAGRWMLKRSEHLRRWNKRWIALDAAGENVEIRSDPTDDKPRAGIGLRDVRCVLSKLRRVRTFHRIFFFTKLAQKYSGTSFFDYFSRKSIRSICLLVLQRTDNAPICTRASCT